MRTCVCVRLLLCAILPVLPPVLVGPVRGEVVVAGGSEGGGGAGGAGGGPQFAGLQGAGGGTVRAARGHAATLRCHVLNLGEKAVSWVRSRDLQILSHGGVVFTADARVSVPSPSALAPLAPGLAPPHALTIARLRDSDAGRYECQLNTEPKMSLFFDLVVLDEAEATAAAVVASSTEAGVAEGWPVDGVAVWAAEPVVVAREGGAAELECGARALPHPAGPSPRPALDIRWLKEEKPLVIQEGMVISRLAEATRAESRLRLAHARPQDAGAYVCAVAGGAARAHFTLLVSESDARARARARAVKDDVGQMEAMQRDESVGGGGAGGAARAAGGVPAAVCLLGVLLARLAVL